MESIWLIIVGVLLISISYTINQLRKEFKQTKSTLEKIAKQIGVSDTAIDNIDDELKKLIVKGKKTEAVKMYREITGFSLKNSKEYVDSLGE